MIKKTILQNGLIILTENLPYSDFIACNYLVQCGSQDESDKERGMAHLCEHMVYKGTKQYTVKEFWKKTLDFGGSYNACTTVNSTTFYFSSLAEKWKDNLALLTDAVFSPSFPADELEKERAVIMSELAMGEDDGATKAYQLFYQTMYKGHPNMYYVAGTQKTVRKLTREQLIQFYKKHYTPNNIVLMVSGKIKHEEVVVYVQKLLGKMFPNKKPLPINECELPVQVADNTIVMQGAMQSHIIAYFPLNFSSNKDIYAHIICQAILCSGFGSRMFALREDFSFAYTIDCSLMYNKQNSALAIYAGLDKSDIERYKQEFYKCLKKFVDKGVTQSEVDNAILAQITMYKQETLLPESITFDRASHYMLNLPLMVQTYINALSKITLQEINDFITKYYKPNIDKIGYVTVLQSIDTKK